LAGAPAVDLAGDWSIKVGLDPAVTLTVAPAVAVDVRDEAHDRLPLYDEHAAGWARGAKLRGVAALECTARFMLDPASVHFKSAKGDGPELTRGVDYQIDLEWGTFGRLPGASLNEKSVVWADYRYGQCRIDTVVLDAAGHAALRVGQPHVAVPRPPQLEAGDQPLANLWIPGRTAGLTGANLFPITETAYPEPPRPDPTVAEKLIPATMAKLRAGGHVRILAWGDSVTDGMFAGAENRWQVQFVKRLSARFPQAQIELLHLGWGGRNTDSFLAEPPGSPWNYQEKVLGAKADLIVSEFVNDAYMNRAQVEARYSKLQADFKATGSEWIILTPHYVRPDWMALTKERDCDDDPRPYTKALREFAAAHQVALADASLRWGRLWRQGVPYTTLLLNAINHPDARGMKLFADALMALFPDA
jgi:lysophospholipase L1-like esterase